MLLIKTFCVILFVVHVCSIAEPAKRAKPNYLTDKDFERALKLSTLVPNGTIFNPPHNDIKHSRQNKIIVKRNAWKYDAWPKARVPYTLDANFNDYERAEVAKAFTNYHSKTCVRFVAKLSTDTDYVKILRDDNTCGLAELCRKGGAQFAKFGGTCINSGTMSHELGHTLCFMHEQSRADRDNFISWNTRICTPHEINSEKDYTTFDLMYDYVSLQHYEGECYNGCITPKIPGVTKCGSGGGLSVLDVEKINAKYNCGGCLSYRFRPISLITNDNLVTGGIDGSDTFVPCRGYVNGDIIPGKSVIRSRSCWIGWNGKEYKLTEKFEVLTNPQKANIKWITKPVDGSFPSNAIPGGRSAQREALYIGRCTMTINGKTTTIVGKIQRSANSGMYVPYGGFEYICNNYNILVCG